MCTVSWRATQGTDGYDLFFSRDESRQRAPGTPPSLHHPPGGRPFLAGTDPDGGGSWLAADGTGTSVGIVNLYPNDTMEPHPTAPRSRGLLVLDCIREPAAMGDIDPAPYEPFLLFRVTLPLVVGFWRWDGRTFSSAPADPPVTTSSFETGRVVAARRAAFVSAGSLEAFHRWRNPDDPAAGVLMERADARTVSLSHVQAVPGRTTFTYYDPPDAATGTTLHLSRSP